MDFERYTPAVEPQHIDTPVTELKRLVLARKGKVSNVTLHYQKRIAGGSTDVCGEHKNSAWQK